MQPVELLVVLVPLYAVQLMMETGKHYASLAVGRAGHFRYFLIFSIIKTDFLLFYHVNLTGNGLFK